MTARTRLAFALLWMVSVVVLSAFVAAQTRRETGAVISGDNIGFRPEGWNGTARTSIWVVRINGEWVEAQSVMKAVPATR